MSTALVLGGAAGVWAEAAAALALGEFDAVVACNDAAAAYPGRIDAAVSLHPEQWGLWMERRRRAGHPHPNMILGHEEARTSVRRMPECVTGFVGQYFPGQTNTGSSGLLALKVALLDLGHDKAVLCGVPMTAVPHFFDDQPWGGPDAHWRGWVQALPQIKDRARSMSGRTRDVLGAPDMDWLSA